MFQWDPGPWSQLLIEWLATLGVIIVFGLVMLYSASYTTGYLRMGSSLHYIGVQLIYAGIGLGIMFVMSFVDHRFLRWAAKPAYWVVLALLAFMETETLCSTKRSFCRSASAGSDAPVASLRSFSWRML